MIDFFFCTCTLDFLLFAVGFVFLRRMFGCNTPLVLAFLAFLLILFLFFCFVLVSVLRIRSYETIIYTTSPCGRPLGLGSPYTYLTGNGSIYYILTTSAPFCSTSSGSHARDALSSASFACVLGQIRGKECL